MTKQSIGSAYNVPFLCNAKTTGDPTLRLSITVAYADRPYYVLRRLQLRILSELKENMGFQDAIDMAIIELLESVYEDSE